MEDVFDEDGVNKELKKEFNEILKEAERKYDEDIDWRKFTDLFLGFDSEYMPQERQEQKAYFKSNVFQRIMFMKFDLESTQKNFEVDNQGIINDDIDVEYKD